MGPSMLYKPPPSHAPHGLTIQDLGVILSLRSLIQAGPFSLQNITILIPSLWPHLCPLGATSTTCLQLYLPLGTNQKWTLPSSSSCSSLWEVFPALTALGDLPGLLHRHSPQLCLSFQAEQMHPSKSYQASLVLSVF